MTASPTRGEVWQRLAGFIDRLDARLLIEHVTGATHAQLITAPEWPLSEAEYTQVNALARRRAAGEPLAYLVGWAPFAGLRLTVSPAVLVPRPETERLLEQALASILGVVAPCVLDLGTGSGAIALAIRAARPEAQVTAVDASADALAVARANGARLSLPVTWRLGSWYGALADENRFDLIVSNPPYVAVDDPHLGGDGLRFEPRMALTDGADGLACLREILAGAAAWLNPDGWLWVEHGYDQGAACRELLETAGYRDSETRLDLAGIERVSGGRWPG